MHLGYQSALTEIVGLEDYRKSYCLRILKAIICSPLDVKSFIQPITEESLALDSVISIAFQEKIGITFVASDFGGSLRVYVEIPIAKQDPLSISEGNLSHEAILRFEEDVRANARSNSGQYLRNKGLPFYRRAFSTRLLGGLEHRTSQFAVCGI